MSTIHIPMREGMATTNDWLRALERVPPMSACYETSEVMSVGEVRYSPKEKAREAIKKVFAEHATLFDKLAK